MREIVLDTETTGLSFAQGHRLVEIGCVEIVHGMCTGKTFHRYINPERDISEEAFRVHGLSRKFLSDHPAFRDVFPELLDFLKDSHLVIHNARFDMGFLNGELNGLGVVPLPNKIIDTLLLARQRFPGSPANLDALCRQFNIDISQRFHHGALLDAQLLSQVYIELTGGRQRNLAFSAQENRSDGQESKSVKKPLRPARFFPLETEDAENYQQLREKLLSLKKK